jgi:hypothetical protein
MTDAEMGEASGSGRGGDGAAAAARRRAPPPPSSSDDGSGSSWETEEEGSGSEGGSEPSSVAGGAGDPLFDPHADDEDEAWVAKRRRGRGTTDALLSCPGCFATLALECQRHARYHNQFRAVAVQGCRVLHGQPSAAAPREPPPRQARRRGGGRGPPQEHQPQPLAPGAAAYQPLLCATCDTEVGVWDVGERVFHIFAALPSDA